MRLAMVAMTGASMGVAAPMPLQKGLEPGQWELRDREADGEVRRLCLTDLRQLLQLQHGRNMCRIFTVSDTAHRQIVTYDCGGAGNGRTDLRVETSRLVQIQSQGIADGAPFAFALEGRWAGACR